MSFDIARAYQLAAFSEAAYLDEHEVDAGKLKAAFVVPIEFDAFTEHGPLGVAALLGGDRQNLILAFRGTVMEVRNWKQLLLAAANWLVSLAFEQVEHQQHGWRIHRGFGQVIAHVWEQINDTVRSRLRPGQRLWITGHSVGGALACLAANEFGAAGRVTVAGTYTFGAPRVGDSAFAAACRTPHYRIENRHDIVPHLPPPPSLVGIGRAILAGPLAALEGLLAQGVVLRSPGDRDFASGLAAFLGNLVTTIRRCTEIEYQHSGSLKYFDPDDEFIDLDGPLDLPEGLRFLIDEDALREANRFSCDLSRFVTFLVQLVEDLQRARFSFFADHKMSNYLAKIRARGGR